MITQGQEGLFFYGIEDGECEVLVNGKHVANLTPGSSFGELALMNKTKCAATIRVTQPCKLWKLDRDTFDILLMRNANNQLGRLKSFLTHVALLSSLENHELESVAEQLKMWAQHVLTSGAAQLEQLSSDARWLVLGSTLVLGVNVLGMSVG